MTTAPTMGSTTETTRDSPSSPVATSTCGRTTRTAPATIPTARSTSSTSTRRGSKCGRRGVLAGESNLTRDEARQRASLIHDLRYHVTLDLTGEEDFGSTGVIRFRCREPGAETFVDLTANEVSAAELNGKRLPAGSFDGNRILLTGLAEENELRLDARCAYHRTELGMHRFVDPVDGFVYLHTDFEPFDAHRVYACFYQAALKGVFEFSVLCRSDWV